MSLLELLRENATLISALASAGMFVIWSVYAWLFYGQFLRQRQSYLFLHAAGNVRVDPECLLVNLSQEPVHVLFAMAVRGRQVVVLYDRSDDPLTIQNRVKQGPLAAGESISLGSFDAISQELDDASGATGPEEEHLIEIRVAAIHGAHSAPVGARRAFRWTPSERRVIEATRATEQLRSRRQAKTVQRWLEQC